MIRSNFLVHWTGKDISLSPAHLTKELRSLYVQRLQSILTDGFWMNVPGTETLKGGGKGIIQFRAHMTCFTEIKLSQVNSHAASYGLLGIGVDRAFVLNRNGGPVHYVRNSPHECIVDYSSETLKFLTAQENQKKLVNHFLTLCGFLKPMSNPDVDDFKYIEEHEWRIVHTGKQQFNGSIRVTGLATPVYKIPVLSKELRLIVFPDDQTLRDALATKAVRELLDAAPNRPILLTLSDCEQL